MDQTKNFLTSFFIQKCDFKKLNEEEKVADNVATENAIEKCWERNSGLIMLVFRRKNCFYAGY